MGDQLSQGSTVSGDVAQNAQQHKGFNPTSTLLSSLPAIIQSFSGLNNKSQNAISNQSQQYSNAMANPQNPLYQQLYGQFNQQNKQNAASTIAAADNQNRLSSAMGRTPLFSPERNGQESFRQSVLGSQNAGDIANTQTQTALGNASRGLTGYGGALGAANAATEGNTANKALNVGGYQDISQLLRGFGY